MNRLNHEEMSKSLGVGLYQKWQWEQGVKIVPTPKKIGESRQRETAGACIRDTTTIGMYEECGNLYWQSEDHTIGPKQAQEQTA